MSDHHSASYANNGSGGLYRSSSWQERRHKRNEDRRHKQDGECSSSGEGSSQTYRSTSKVLEQEHHDKRDQALEHLYRLVRDLELEVCGRHRRMNRDESSEGSISDRDSHGEVSHQSGSHWSRERSRDFADKESVSLEQHRHQSAAMDAMSRTLCRAAQSPFSNKIEHA